MAARLAAYLVACIVGATFIAGLIVGAQRDDAGPVDLIVTNGRVYTGVPGAEVAEAVAVQGNKVLRVGANREILRLRRARTTVIDARGGSVLAGFNDAHQQFIAGGLGLDQLSLFEAPTLDAIKDTVRAWADAHPERTWIRGRGWSEAAFAGGPPSRQILDALVPDRPVFLVAGDGHSGWANTAALRAAGITRRTASPDHGLIVKEAPGGEPTGVLKDAAMDLVEAVAPQPTREDRLAAVRAAIVDAHRAGITSVHSAGGSPEDLDLLDELRRRGELTVRVSQALSIGSTVTDAELDGLELVREEFADDPVLKAGAAALEAGGDANQPAAGEPQTPAADVLQRLVARLHDRGWQVMTHATGDRAVDMALEAYERATAGRPMPARGWRHRIEGVELVERDDLPRFPRLGIVASMQPARAVPRTDADAWAVNLGQGRAERRWMFGSMLRARVPLVFGSGWPAAPSNPLLGIATAITRGGPIAQSDDGAERGERLALAQAVDAYTRGAAWASFDELRKGTLARDMLADFVILSKDIFALPPARLLEADVVMTIADGKVVYRRDAPDTTEH